MTTTPPHRARLAERVRARRVNGLGLTAEQVRQKGGPSGTVLSHVERGLPDNFDDRTYAALDRALGWEPGSAKRIDTEGGEPVEVSPSRVATLAQPLPAVGLSSSEVLLPDGSVVVLISTAPLTAERVDALRDEIVRRTAQ